METQDIFKFNSLNNFFNNKFVIWLSDFNKNYEVYSYSDIISAAKEILIILDDIGSINSDRIALHFDHCPQIIPLILGILNKGCSFCSISAQLKDEIKMADHIKVFSAKFLITSLRFEPEKTIKFKLKREISIFKEKVYFYQMEPSNQIKSELVSYNFCYLIQTSGSTGTPKIIKVPYSCISSNIENLSSIYKITSEDVIFISAPPTFDPFILDVFLTLRNGASMLMMPKHLRLNSEQLIDVINPVWKKNDIKVTIMQITPSVLKILGQNFLEKVIFNEESKLRILTLGGEQFPFTIDEIKSWTIWNFTKRKKQIFNIYGITEISCWSTIQEITSNTNSITLGSPIDNETVFQIRNLNDDNDVEGELLIGSKTRKCVIGNENFEILMNSDEILYRSTGDLVSITNDNDKEQIIFKGRINDCIKRYGNRVNLLRIEEIIKIEWDTDACCVFDISFNRLILFLKVKNEISKQDSQIWYSKLKMKFENFEIPDDIIFIEKFPLSLHDKISKKELLKIYKKKQKKDNSESLKKNCKNIVGVFQCWMLEILGISEQGELGPESSLSSLSNAKRMKRLSELDSSKSFIELGGNSFQALNLITKLENLTNETYPDILIMLLKSDYKLDEIFTKLQNVYQGNIEKRISTAVQENKKCSLNISWKYNMGKCVDSSPTLVNLSDDRNVISVGSHSHLLVNLDINDGTIISSLKLPDRIESEIVVVSNLYGIVGCYDGNLYKFNICTGELCWKFESNAMIKCKSLVFMNFIIFGNYSNEQNLFCLNSNDGSCIWSKKFGIKGILSSPVQIDSETFIVCTLDGTYGRIKMRTGEIYWESILSNMTPIFSTSQKLNMDCLILSGVNGIVYGIDLSNGKQLWEFKVGGTIFSSFETIEDLANNSINIYFGCHDQNVYCLEYKCNSNDKIALKWKQNLQSQIYSTPKKLYLNGSFWLVVCSTIGFVNILDLNDCGKTIVSIKLDGEIFSSPAIHKNSIFVGCRDDNLYAIEFIEKENKN